jgi:hypothetical protein
MSRLRAAIERARDQFLFYEQSHRTKLTKGPPLTPEQRDDTLKKAEVNKELAIEMQAALDDEPFDVLALEKVQDYRFGSLVKGQHYSFARGLTINPTHLPAALDAMLNDGFELVCMFGDPQSDKMGLIFRHTGPDPRVQGLLEANNREVERRRSAERLMREFVERVDRGEVRSKRTYAAFKEHLERHGN